MFKRFTLSPVAVVALASVTLSPLAFAQLTTTDVPATQSLERVEVTGSSIKRAAAEGSLPITILKEEDIKRTGATSITELIQMLPQMQGFVPASNSVNGGGNGSTTAALHSLPSKYTLVLLDGQRIAPLALANAVGGGYGVNLESIPLGAIDRVEILTDGASATYGSDAIAGVVNFILKKNKTDGTASITGNHPQRAGGSSWNLAVSKGFGDLQSNGYNVLVALGHDNQEKLQASQRSFSKNGAYIPFSFNGTNYIFNGRTSNTEPANTTFSAKPIGAAASTPATGYALNPYYRANGNCGSSLAGVILDPTGQGSLGAVGESCRFNYAATVQDIPQSRRDTGLAKVAFKVAEDTTIWGSLSLSQFTLKSQYAPGAQPLGIGPTLRGGVVGNTFPSLFAKYISPFLTANNLQFVPNSGKVGYRTVDLGGRTDEYETDGRHFAFGVEGSAAGFDYDVTVALSNTNLTDTAAGGYSDFDQFNALVASGAYDPFAGQGDGVLKGGILGTQFSKTVSDLNSVKGQIQHDLFNFGLGAESSKLAVGADFAQTHYKIEYSPLYLTQSGFSTQPASSDYPIGGNYGAVPFDASRHNYGAFGEWLIPVIKQLEFTASARYDHYGKTHSKNVFNTTVDPDTGLYQQTADEDLGDTFQSTTGKLSMKFTPIEQLLIRAAYGTGFKAPNISDIAGPVTFSGSTSGTYVCPFPGSTGCSAGSAQYDLLAGGNGLAGSAGLKPEKSKQWTVGFRVDPFRGFSAGLDVWDIKLTNQVLSQGISEQLAFKNPSTYANLFINPYLDPVGFPTIGFQQLPFNGGNAEYQGIDWDVVYSQKFDFGLVGARFGGTEILKQNYDYGTTDSTPRSDLGKFGDDQQVVFRTIFNLAVSLDTHGFFNVVTMHYRSGYKDAAYDVGGGVYLANPDGTQGTAVAFAGLRAPSYTTFDWQGKYTFSKTFQLAAGVKNILDRNPPFSLQSGGGGNQVGYDGRYADPIGRQFYMTGEVHF